VEFFNDLLDENSEIGLLKNQIERHCADLYHKMLASGMQEEDAREIFSFVDLSEVLQVTNVQVISLCLEQGCPAAANNVSANNVSANNVAVTTTVTTVGSSSSTGYVNIKVEVPDKTSDSQNKYLEMLKEKYHASLGSL
jgi:hypothetical protein